MVNQSGLKSEAVAGCGAGVAGTLIGYPLDSIKTRMQAGVGTSAYNSGMIPTAKNVVKYEGFSGFYRGVASPLAALTILNTLNFSSYATFRQAYCVSDDLIANGSFEWKVPIAAASVGPLASMISTPFELVKTQMVINNKNSPSSATSSRPSSIKTAISIVRNHGIRSLYSAHLVNTSREVVFLSTYFTVYEHVKNGLSKFLDKQLNISDKGSIPIAGGIAGATGWFVSFPLDCIKSNIQGIPFSKGKSITHPGAFQVATNLLKSGSLYRGVVPSITRAFLVSASRFSVYEGILNIMSDH
jgi:solute carrier family 25 (mitochondrial carnitine/acylcarnitine transporter), member 20/29